MFVKAFGYNIDGQAQNYVLDQKMGHYQNTPPQSTFRGQILSVFIGTFISPAITNWQITGGEIKDICRRQQNGVHLPPQLDLLFSACLWGTIGPKRVFGGLCSA